MNTQQQNFNINLFMKTYLTISILLICLNLFGQEKEHEMHIKSIRASSASAKNKDNIKDSTFLDYAINNIIKPDEIIFISNRNLLPKLTIKSCNKWHVDMSGTIDKNKTIHIELSTKEFDSTENTFIKFKDSDSNEKINGQNAHGAIYGNPEMEFEQIKITIDTTQLIIPDSAYKNLFDPNFCEYYGFIRNVSAYTSLDGKYIYLYIYGGNAANTYFAKLIFDHKKFITKWVVDYVELCGYLSERFIGF